MQKVEGCLEAHLSFAASRQPWQCAASAQCPNSSVSGSWGASGAAASISAGLNAITVMLRETHSCMLCCSERNACQKGFMAVRSQEAAAEVSEDTIILDLGHFSKLN